jgi:LPXTG-motif cell wall-anchored protein
LTPDSTTVWALVLGLPLLMGLALVAGWRFGVPAGDRDRGESGD